MFFSNSARQLEVPLTNMLGTAGTRVVLAISEYTRGCSSVVLLVIKKIKIKCHTKPNA